MCPLIQRRGEGDQVEVPPELELKWKKEGFPRDQGRGRNFLLIMIFPPDKT